MTKWLGNIQRRLIVCVRRQLIWKKRQVSNKMYILKLDGETRKNFNSFKSQLEKNNRGVALYVKKFSRMRKNYKSTVRKTPVFVKVVVCVTKEHYLTYLSTVLTIFSPSKSEMCILYRASNSVIYTAVQVLLVTTADIRYMFELFILRIKHQYIYIRDPANY